MKKFTIIIFALLISYTGYSQSKKVLKQQIAGLTNQVDSLRSVSKNLSEKNGRANKQVDSLKFQIYQMDLDLKTAKRNFEDCKAKEERQKSEAIKTQIQTKPESTSANQCKAFTLNGTQCSRNAEIGSSYCWQHGGKAEVDNPSKPSNSSGATGEGQKIYTGPRGGKYYINGSGKKVYIKR